VIDPYDNSIIIIEILPGKIPPFMHFIATDPFITDAYGIGLPMRKIVVHGKDHSLRYLVNKYLSLGRYNYCLVTMEDIT
jgi:hypothetical protein